MSRLFINYAQHDKEAIRRLVELLMRAGHVVWFEQKPDNSRSWDEVIRLALQKSDGFVYCLTQGSLQSAWCKWSLIQAVQLNKPGAIFMLQRGLHPPEVLQVFPQVDFTQGITREAIAAMQDVLNDLSTTLPAEAVAKSPPPPPGAPPQALGRTGELPELSTLMRDFFQVYEAQKWQQAMVLLKQLEATGQAQRMVENYQTDIQARLEREQWLESIKGEYNAILALLEHNPQQAWQALQAFWQKYSTSFDPENIRERLANIAAQQPTPARQSRITQVLQPVQAGERKPAPSTTTRPAASPEVERMLAEISDPYPKLKPHEYQEIGRRLAEIGDPRPGVGLDANGLPEIDWIAIPEGEFTYQNSQILELATFYVARYPITHAQFQAFIDAPDGYDNTVWWRGLAERQSNPGRPRWGFPNHPREKVSWYDAIAFCRWLSSKLGFEITLPTEEQWEKAAQGTSSRLYPYGDAFDPKKCNIAETKIGSTTAVGLFPQGASPYGVLDMSGNVEEWCLNAYTSGTHSLEEKLERVLRGGAWNQTARLGSTISREKDDPSMRTGNRGFRVVCERPQALP